MNLKQIAKEKQLTQQAISESTGLSRSAVNRAFQGKPAQSATLQVICQALGVKLSDVTGVTVHSGTAAQAAKMRRG